MVDDTRFRPEPNGQFFGRSGLKRDETVSEFERLLSGSVYVDVVVNICSSECQDERTIRVRVAETDDRFVAAFCVESDEDVGFAFFPGFEDTDAMP